MPILVDTGVLYALADRDDDWHARTDRFIAESSEVLLVPSPVIPEVTYLLRTHLGALAEQRFVESLAEGELGVEEPTVADLRRCVAILGQYPAIGFVDAAVVAIAERLRVKTIATTDRRHFTTIRPLHQRAFTLVP